MFKILLKKINKLEYRYETIFYRKLKIRANSERKLCGGTEKT